MNHLLPTIKFTFQHSIQQISFLDMKLQIRVDRKLSITRYRKSTDCVALLHFNSNHSLKCRETIAFSQALRHNVLLAGDSLLQKELDSLATSLLARKYPLDTITHNISKVPLRYRDTLLHETTMASGPRTVLSIITPYSIEGKIFSQSVGDQWHMIDNNPKLHNIWPNPPITAYHKTESLKDILKHSCQAKLIYPLHLFQPQIIIHHSAFTILSYSAIKISSEPNRNTYPRQGESFFSRV